MDSDVDTSKYPPLGRAIVAPLVAVILLMINPIGSISGIAVLSSFKVDAMYILPVAGIVGMLAMGQGSHILKYSASGLNKMTAAATASTSTGVILATGSFGEAILNMGTAPLAAAVMVHTGATVIDSLPQGNYFHVTADSMKMSIKQRMGLIPYEAIVGGAMTIVATLMYGFIF